MLFPLIDDDRNGELGDIDHLSRARQINNYIGTSRGHINQNIELNRMTFIVPLDLNNTIPLRYNNFLEYLNLLSNVNTPSMRSDILERAVNLQNINGVARFRVDWSFFDRV
jgi:hypothetical protein